MFAPTNSAFAELASSLGMTLTQVLQLPFLADILTYHVVPSKILAEDLMDGERITTVEGEPLTITINELGAFVNNIQITETDLLASNGVVHVISGVLLPPFGPPSSPPPLSPESGTVVDVAGANGLTDLGQALMAVSAMQKRMTKKQSMTTDRLIASLLSTSGRPRRHP